MLPIKKGDTAKPIRIPLADADGPALLLGATCTFHMKQVKGVKAVTRVAQAVNEAAPADDPDAGWVEVWPQAGDVDTPGIYRGDVTVVFGNGKQETFPSEGWFMIQVYDTAAP
jgi:hypothetical protein